MLLGWAEVVKFVVFVVFAVFVVFVVLVFVFVVSTDPNERRAERLTAGGWSANKFMRGCFLFASSGFLLFAGAAGLARIGVLGVGVTKVGVANAASSTFPLGCHTGLGVVRRGGARGVTIFVDGVANS